MTGGVFEGFAADDLVPAKAAISGAVSLSGRDLVAEEFSFELRDVEGNVVATAKNDAKGTIEFSVDIDRTGVFQYTIAAVSGDLDGVTYDEKEWPVQVVSSSEDGVLSATVIYPDGEPTFEMTYEDSPDVPEPSPDPDPGVDPDPRSWSGSRPRSRP